MEHLTSALTFLVIDPKEQERQYWITRLKTSFPDCLLIEAPTGAAGLATCRSKRIDCVVVEMLLPDMSVFQLLLELVPLVRHPDVAIIVVSRQTSLPMAQLALSNGAQAFLVKSHMSGDDLERAIRKALAAVGPRKEEAKSRAYGEARKP